VFSNVHNGNIRRRIALMGGMLIVAPLLTLGIAGWIVVQRMSQTILISGVRTSTVHLENLTRGLVDICRSYQQASIDTLKSGRSVVDAAGAIGIDQGQRVAWRVKNEATGEIGELRLPVMSAGDTHFLAVADFSQPTPRHVAHLQQREI